MTFKTVFLQLLVFLSINSFSQTGKFILKPNWKQGEVKELTVSSEFFWIMNGQKDKSSEPTKTYQIEILESNEKGYLVEWKVSYNETNEDEFMQNYIDNFNYQIQLDKNGKFIELKNWNELIELNKSLKEKIVSMAKSENISDSEIEKQLSQMNLPLTKSELIEWFQGLTDVYLAGYGEEYQLDTVIKSPTVIPNRNFKDGIPATQVIETRTLSDNLISINYSTIYDYDILEKLFKENFPNQENHESKMNSSSNYIYNSKTGWIEKIEISSETETEFEKTGFNMNYVIK